MSDSARRAHDELRLCDGLFSAFNEQKTIAEKRKVQSERLTHAANAAALFHEAEDPAKEAVSYLLSSGLLLQLMEHESNDDERVNCSHQLLRCCESAFESLSHLGRFDVAVRGLAKIVENLAYATTLVGEAANPKLGTALDKYSKALGANMALLLEMESVGRDCLSNSAKLGVYSKYAVNSDKAGVLQLKKDFDSYAAMAFNLTGNRQILKEVERVSAETRALEEVREVQTVQFCEGCGKQLPADQLYCPHCGRKQEVVGVSFCEGCGKQIAAELAYCPNCGRRQTAP